MPTTKPTVKGEGETPYLQPNTPKWYLSPTLRASGLFLRAYLYPAKFSSSLTTKRGPVESFCDCLSYSGCPSFHPSSTMGSFVFHGKRLRGTHSSSTGGAASTEIEGTQPQPNTQTTIIYGKSRKVVIEREYYACRNILCWPAQCFQAFESIAKNYKSEDFS